jgi:transcription initiation factor TFIID subunit TAF12
VLILGASSRVFLTSKQAFLRVQEQQVPVKNSGLYTAFMLVEAKTKPSTILPKPVGQPKEGRLSLLVDQQQQQHVNNIS